MRINNRWNKFFSQVDILTWVTWKLSNVPVHKIIGTGTQIDSSRFRFLLSERLGISPSSVSAWIIGEHGDSQGRLLYRSTVLSLVRSSEFIQLLLFPSSSSLVRRKRRRCSVTWYSTEHRFSYWLRDVEWHTQRRDSRVSRRDSMNNW